MAFLKNNKFAEIRESAKNGNEKAQMILQAMLKGDTTQGDLDNLVNDYYAVPNVELAVEEPVVEEVIEQQPMPEPNVDLSLNLDDDMKGLLDENELEDLSFGDFLKNRQKDLMRAKKNSDYFKIYDVNGRDNYMKNKIDAYTKSFDGRHKDINRAYRDNNIALDNYSKKVGFMLDDGVELNNDNTSKAYEELINNDGAMKSFGRHWDEDDNNEMLGVLEGLVQKYGKNNIIALLNTLKSDNEGYVNNRREQIDSEIGRYSKSLEKLLK